MTQTAILKLTDEIHQYMERENCVVRAVVGLSKSLYCIDPNILLHKLENIGVRGLPQNLFASFLPAWKQAAFCNNNTSNLESIVKGVVPQGSILGCILFVVYINDTCVMIVISLVRFCLLMIQTSS